jgi:hypothetical protein
MSKNIQQYAASSPSFAIIIKLKTELLEDLINYLRGEA